MVLILTCFPIIVPVCLTTNKSLVFSSLCVLLMCPSYFCPRVSYFYCVPHIFFLVVILLLCPSYTCPSVSYFYCVPHMFVLVVILLLCPSYTCPGVSYYYCVPHILVLFVLLLTYSSLTCPICHICSSHFRTKLVAEGTRFHVSILPFKMRTTYLQSKAQLSLKRGG